MIDNYEKPIIAIKNALSKSEEVLGIFISRGTIEDDSTIYLFILIKNDNYVEKVIDIVTSTPSGVKIQPDIWTLDAFLKSDQDTIHHIFKESRLVYWNAMVDILASQVFKVKTYTIFTFSFKEFSQNEKVKFNYQLYGKKNNGLINQWEGRRLAKSCFYVPYANKYKVTRYLNKNDIKYEQKDTYF